jgi:hypothetical protein
VWFPVSDFQAFNAKYYSAIFMADRRKVKEIEGNSSKVAFGEVKGYMQTDSR